jgi:hypothetical protein
MDFSTEKDEEGNDRVTIPAPVIVVEGTLMRITGSGAFVVYPDQHGTEAHEGSRVIVLNSMGNRVQVSLEVVKERVDSPYLSDFTIIVGARKRVERCNVWCDGRKLLALDPVGTPEEELPLPIGGYLYFRVPKETKVELDTVVKVRDGSVILRQERFKNIVGATETALARRRED